MTFGAGDATATLRLGTQDDTRPGEADTPVTLALVDGAEYDLGTPSRATVAVRDDDETPEVSIADAAPVTEGGTIEFPVTLNRPYSEAITVLYFVGRDGPNTAKKGTDYTDVTVAHADGEFSFAPGEVRKTVSLRDGGRRRPRGGGDGQASISVTERSSSPTRRTSWRPAGSWTTTFRP